MSIVNWVAPVEKQVYTRYLENGTRKSLVDAAEILYGQECLQHVLRRLGERSASGRCQARPEGASKSAVKAQSKHSRRR